MNSLVWSADLKSAFQSLRNSKGLDVSSKALKADEAKALAENNNQIKPAIQVYWN
ncbi:hypothetical protein [Paenibacillus sp. GP183]|uniref:hypothetical protein n=1 Tax=Paenibacillus sp. GP183 TaxID=1882751 RepID=UPI0008981E3F|nr:hypothetical protein [Paenibacillus sp. GP183]SEC50118.1 hypothetical protein SAMN05443246_4319 [Paenibacillus sp. GP183]